MRNRWHLIGHASEVANPGDFVVLPFATDREIVLSNIEGEIVAWDNLCPHRGTRIYTEPRGNRPPVCGYHKRFARAAEVRRFNIATMPGSFLFVCTDPVAPPLDELAARQAAEFLGNTPPLRFHSEIRSVYTHDWTVAVENALDNEHVPLVHGDSLATLGLTRGALHSDPDGSSLEVFVSAQADRLDRVGKLFERRLQADYSHAHFFPYAAIATTRGWTYALQNYFPRSDGGTTFVSRLFVQDCGEHETGRMRWATAVANMNERVFAEDGAICDLVQVGFTGNLGPRDDRIRHFRANLRPGLL